MPLPTKKESKMSGLEKLITIQLDRERHLRLTLKGMLEFERLTGRSLLKGFALKDLTLKDSAAMMYACLLHEDKELTYDDVIGMVDFSNLPTVIEAFYKCINQSVPETEEKSKRPLAKTSRHRHG